jgi:MoxR-like ATPase
LARLIARPAVSPKRLPPVLIQGETGTGKGLVAHVLHGMGPRAEAAFVDVNCAAIPDTLLEAELFGFERGAFTDARQAKPGLLQVAHRGTIFLDEIGLMPDALQAKLLKALEDRSVRRLGGTRAEPADAWVLAATSEDLAAAIRTRRFREDLYHRLAVMTVQLPPLRERGNDILLLARHYLDRACREYGLPIKVLAADAEAALLAYTWPGNVRELANAMERVALLSDAEQVTASALRLPRALRIPAGPPRGDSVNEEMTTLERARIEEALRAVGWNISHAAARLGLPRNTLRYRMERHGLTEGGESANHRRRSESTPTRSSDEEAVHATGEPPSPVRWQRTRVTLLQAQVLDANLTAEHERTRVIEQIAGKASAFGGRIIELGAPRRRCSGSTWSRMRPATQPTRPWPRSGPPAARHPTLRFASHYTRRRCSSGGSRIVSSSTPMGGKLRSRSLMGSWRCPGTSRSSRPPRPSLSWNVASTSSRSWPHQNRDACGA